MPGTLINSIIEEDLAALSARAIFCGELYDASRVLYDGFIKPPIVPLQEGGGLRGQSHKFSGPSSGPEPLQLRRARVAVHVDGCHAPAARF
jgi:hypothetical protein